MSKKPLRTLDALVKKELIDQASIPDLQQVVSQFSVSISEQMHALIDKTDPHDPIAMQFVPTRAELHTHTMERSDPIGDKAHTAVKGIIHRYPDRCLFTPVHICPVYCRFCFRRENVGEMSQTLNPDEFEKAYSYIQENKSIWEVIITGGDPLILKPTILEKILNRLCAIEHVEVIRIHTRVPLVDSERINAEMIRVLQCEKPLYIVVHANHPKEFTPAASAACRALTRVGIPLLSQTVLLKKLNDSIEVLSELMRCFIKNRIKPYYLHHADLAKGTSHFRTSIAEGQQLMKQLRGRFSGMCQPTYVLDIPGGHGKVPVNSAYITDENELQYEIEDYLGNIHHYPRENF